MSKLEELIQKYCPDGVEYKKLKDIAAITRGGSLQKKDFCENGTPCIHYGQIYTRYGLTATETYTFIPEEIAARQRFAEPGDIVMAVTSENVEDICKCVAWLGKENAAVSGHTAIIHHNQNPKYMSYYFHTEMFGRQKLKYVHGTKVMEVTPDKLNDIVIPVPPLPVQEEIVRLLDSFTQLTAELQAELQARKKQYEYYRDLLLTFGDASATVSGQTRLPELRSAVKWFELKKVANLFRGEYITKKDAKPGSIPVVLGGQEPAYYIDHYNHTGKIITVARSGVSAGFVSYWDEPIFVTDGFGFEAKDIIDIRFLFYILKNMQSQLNNMKRGAGVPHISGETLQNILIPVPPLDEQERIVSILDRFDTLCNDISTGLPAEIEARQKQYEYYRDKLLTFKELS